jgi:hypothetical protein
MQPTLSKPAFRRQRLRAERTQSGIASRLTSQQDGEDRKRCIACGKIASTYHRLKISSGDRPWIVPLCLQCQNDAAPLSAFLVLLWFQARGVDVLALSSRRRLPRQRCID